MSTEITKDADALELPVEEIPADQGYFIVELGPCDMGKKITIVNCSDREVRVYPTADVTLYLEE